MSNEKPPSRTADQFVVRFPDGMRDRIADEAKTNNRSMNAEIVARLQASFTPVQDGDLAERVAVAASILQLVSSLVPKDSAAHVEALARYVRVRAEDQQPIEALTAINILKTRVAAGKKPNA